MPFKGDAGPGRAEPAGRGAAGLGGPTPGRPPHLSRGRSPEFPMRDTQPPPPPHSGETEARSPPPQPPNTRCPPPRGSRQQLGEGGPGPSLNYKWDRPLSEPLCGAGGGPRAQLLPSEGQRRSEAAAAPAGLQNPPPPKQRPPHPGPPREDTQPHARLSSSLCFIGLKDGKVSAPCHEPAMQ